MIIKLKTMKEVLSKGGSSELMLESISNYLFFFTSLFTELYIQSIHIIVI